MMDHIYAAVNVNRISSLISLLLATTLFFVPCVPRANRVPPVDVNSASAGPILSGCEYEYPPFCVVTESELWFSLVQRQVARSKNLRRSLIGSSRPRALAGDQDLRTDCSGLSPVGAK